MKQPLDTCLKGFSNAFWTGLTTLEFAKVIEEILKQNITGLVQVASQEKISKHELISLFNQIYRNGVLNIIKDDHYKVDKSLMSNREDFKYTVPHYIEMIESQKKWMFTHSNLYSHYNL